MVYKQKYSLHRSKEQSYFTNQRTLSCSGKEPRPKANSDWAAASVSPPKSLALLHCAMGGCAPKVLFDRAVYPQQRSYQSGKKYEIRLSDAGFDQGLKSLLDAKMWKKCRGPSLLRYYQCTRFSVQMPTCFSSKSI
jgi:hypothetical protein